MEALDCVRVRLTRLRFAGATELQADVVREGMSDELIALYVRQGYRVVSDVFELVWFELQVPYSAEFAAFAHLNGGAR